MLHIYKHGFICANIHTFTWLCIDNVHIYTAFSCNKVTKTMMMTLCLLITKCAFSTQPVMNRKTLLRASSTITRQECASMSRWLLDSSRSWHWCTLWCPSSEPSSPPSELKRPGFIIFVRCTMHEHVHVCMPHGTCVYTVHVCMSHGMCVYMYVYVCPNVRVCTCT